MTAVQFEKKGSIAILTIDRPKALNALNNDVFNDLNHHVETIHQDDEIRAAIITGMGEKAFAAGADISEFPSLDAQQGEQLSLRGMAVMNKIENGPKPFIAAVNGFALGGGCELSMCCHIRIASSNARFGQPEVNLGLLPGYGGTQRLAQICGKGRAQYLLLTAKMISAEEALGYGLVSEVHSSEELLGKAIELANLIASKGSQALSLTIEAVQYPYGQTDGLNNEARLFGQAMGSEEAKEGVQAFLEKRKPNWLS